MSLATGFNAHTAHTANAYAYLLRRADGTQGCLESKCSEKIFEGLLNCQQPAEDGSSSDAINTIACFCTFWSGSDFLQKVKDCAKAECTKDDAKAAEERAKELVKEGQEQCKVIKKALDGSGILSEKDLIFDVGSNSTDPKGNVTDGGNPPPSSSAPAFGVKGLFVLAFSAAPLLASMAL